MKTSFFVQQTSNLFTENRLLKVSILIIAFAVIVNSYMVHQAVKYQRVILIPPKMTGTIEFVQGKPTKNYLKSMAREIINLATTYTPATARNNFSDLLALYDPTVFAQAKKQWYDLAARVEDSRVSSVFYMQHIKVYPKKGQMNIFGEQRQYAADGTVFESGTMTYFLKYKIRDGRMFIVSIKQKKGGGEE